MTPRSTTPSCNLASWNVSTLQPVGRGQGRREGRGLRLRGEVLAGVDEEVLLKTVLLVVQLPVAAPPGEQLRVGAALDDLAALDHQDLIRAADGRQAMRDDEGGTASPQVAEPVLDRDRKSTRLNSSHQIISYAVFCLKKKKKKKKKIRKIKKN